MIIKTVSHLLMVMLVTLFSTSSKPHPATHLKDILPLSGGNYRPGMLTDVIDRFVNDDKKDKATKVFTTVLMDSNEDASNKENTSHGEETLSSIPKNNSLNHNNNGSGGGWIKINTSARVEGSAWVDAQNSIHLLKVNFKLRLD